MNIAIMNVFAALSNTHALSVGHQEDHVESRAFDPSYHRLPDHDVPHRTRQNPLSYKTVGVRSVGEFKEPAFAVDKMQNIVADEVAMAAQEIYAGEQQLELSGLPQALTAAPPSFEELKLNFVFKQLASIHIWLVIFGSPLAVLAFSQWAARRPSHSEKQRSINKELTFSYQLDQATRGTWMKGLFEVGLNARLQAEANHATNNGDKVLLSSEPSIV
eukprot:gnl/MRDRNA2_/MRDRNA2_146449_c0_seq1.p1 gnl/MRDRNA2_/MRDRNA2_146449_c0~~gnl/MRDRNA2_/MRDRNA2_146449_c0_seq1.p1  ORF type:complete len:217 (-),score=29.20 gnl/MRDRNA2_/MRDRNA2_146449_c0_seq1:94-744(-)